MTGLGGADPASCSRLGGALRSGAARLSARAHDLEPAGRAAAATQDVAARLDAVGAVLQAHAQELAELGAATERLSERVAAEGLVLDGWRVAEPFGVTEASTALRRQAARPGLQAQADRLASRIGRARAQVDRAVGDSTAGLALASRALGEA